MILSCHLEKSNHLILLLKFPNQYQMVLSCHFRKIESLDFDSKISKSISNGFVVRFQTNRNI